MNPLEFIYTTWRSMGIVRKFTAALGSMLALILFVAAVGFASLHVLEQKAGNIVADSMRMQRLALEIDSRLQLARQAERDFAQRVTDLGVDEARAIYASEFADRIAEAGRNVAWLQDMERFSVNRKGAGKSAARLAELQEALGTYSTHFRALVQTAMMGGVESRAFSRAVGDVDGSYMRLTSQVRQLAIAATDAARTAHEGISRSSLLAEYLLVTSVLFALLLAASIVWVLNRTVAKSLVRLSDTATELSLGNLEARADVYGGDEFGQLGQSINAMAERITTLVNDLEGQAAVASNRLMEAIDSISEGFLLYDSNDVLVLANRKVRDIGSSYGVSIQAGMSAEALLRRYASSGMYTNAVGREEEWVQERMDQHRSPGSAAEEPLGDGRWVLLKTYLTGTGEVVVVKSDVTERKRRDRDMATMHSDLEELVRDRTKVLVEKAMELKEANKRLRELDELKSAFLSSVSHELRTPLTSLLGFSKIIKRDFKRSFMPLAEDKQDHRLGKRIQANLDIIGSEGERLTRLINDVLDLSRIESGKEQWRFTEVDLASVIHRAVDAASGLFSPKPGVHLSIRRFESVPLVHADPDRLHQVFINLLSNAAKFTEVGEVAVDLYVDDAGMVRVCVEDSGCGIEPKFLEDVFDKFHQVQHGDTVTQKPGGTGLGLAICRKIVEHYGGAIWADSRPGRGTNMTMTLPAAEPADKPLVMVVDDDPAVRDYLSLVLKKAGYGVRTAESGEEALELAVQRRPSLITMDILMPGMDGRETIAKLKEKSQLASIPVLVVSVVDDCHTAGGDAALLKPVNGDAFVDTVRALLGDEGTSRPVLALGEIPLPENGILPSMGGNCITCGSEVELWKQLNAGFEGTVLVPQSLVDQIDLARICELPRVQVLLLPDDLSADSEVASTRIS